MVMQAVFSSSPIIMCLRPNVPNPATGTEPNETAPGSSAFEGIYEADAEQVLWNAACTTSVC